MTTKMKAISASVLILVSVLTAGCGKQISPRTYSEKNVGEVFSTFRGVVVSIRPVDVEASDFSHNFTQSAPLIGGAIGAATGALAAGKGKGKIVTTGAGLALGMGAATIGRKMLSRQEGTEYIIKLNDERLVAVVQGDDEEIEEGDNVFLIISDTGRSRVIVDNVD